MLDNQSGGPHHPWAPTPGLSLQPILVLHHFRLVSSQSSRAVCWTADRLLLLRVQAGAEVDVQSLDGLTPLHLAAMGRWTPVVARLLEDGASATLVDCEGCAPLHRAVRLADVDLFNALFPASASCLDQHDAKGGNSSPEPQIASAGMSANFLAPYSCYGRSSASTDP